MLRARTDHFDLQIAEDLFVFLQEFLRLYPQYQNHDFFVTGESYGGHYVPALGYRILQVCVLVFCFVLL